VYIYVLSGAGRHQHSSNMNRIAVHNHTQAGHLQFCSTFVRCGLHTFKCLVKASRSTRNFYQDGILTRLLTLHRHLQWIHLQSSSCSCKSEILSIDILCILCLWQLVIVIALLFVAVRGLLDQIQLLSKVTSCWFCSSTSRTNVSTAGETLDSSYSRYWNRWTHTHLPLRINSPSATCRVSTLWQLEIFASHRNSPQQHSFFENWSAFTTIVGCASGEALSRHWPACTVTRWRQTHRELKVSQCISMYLIILSCIQITSQYLHFTRPLFSHSLPPYNLYQILPSGSLTHCSYLAFPQKRSMWSWWIRMANFVHVPNLQIKTLSKNCTEFWKI